MISARHAGDLGDIVYSLPALRHLLGGQKALFMIEAAGYTRVQLAPYNWCGIDRLLKAQDYIHDVVPYRRGEYAVFNLNHFRENLDEALRKRQQMDKSLCDWVLETHKVPLTAKDTAWLRVPPFDAADVVINRTGAGRKENSCYHNWRFPWHKVWKKYKDRAVFIGSSAEHAMFCATCGEIPYHPTEDLYEAARVIAGAKLFIGNQSVCHAIAEGLKQRILLEVWPAGPNCLFFREGSTHGWDEKVELPDL